MHARHLLIVSLLLCAAVIFAGCTQPGQTSTQPAPLPPAVNISALVLTPADFPSGYQLAASQERTIGDIGTLAKDLGWSGGFVAQYADSPLSNPNSTVITQSIAIYPKANIPYLINLVNTQDRADTDLKYTNLTGIGDGGAGFYGNASSRILVKTTNQNPLSSGVGSHDVQVVYTRDVAEFIFAKGTVFESVRITGPGAVPSLAESLTRAAYGKIP